MRNATKIFVFLIVAAAGLAVLGCPTGPAAPSKDDVSKAFSAMSAASGSTPGVNTVTYSGSGPYTYTTTVTNGSGGTAAVTYSSDNNPNTSACNITGTIVFTNWYDSYTGYTISGTLSISASLSTPNTYPLTLSATITGKLALSGGTVSSLSCNVSETVYFASQGSFPSIAISGNVSANGYQYDITKL